MPNIGPIAYRDDQGNHWLQITIADNGVCTEFKQASEADMSTNTWKTLEQDQWPATIPTYDPSVSQSHFVLYRDSTNKISRHFFSKYTPPGPDQAPIDRVTNQVFSGTHWGPMNMLRDPGRKAELLSAYWRPEADQQAQLQAQYERWQQSQVVVWHRDATHPDLNAPNQPLDFQTTYTGTVKPPIETNLVPSQQWLVKSIIYDRLALLKAESTSSEDYRAALHCLIDGTEPHTPLSGATQKNLEDVKILISAEGINRYMKANFYTKIVEQQNRVSHEMEKQRVPMDAKDPGYGVTIEPVCAYIQQLLLTEILQYFPDYSITITERPAATLVSTFKVGKLPLEQAGAIEESSSNLSPQEIRQIDQLYQLYSNTYPLEGATEESLTELYNVISSIQGRSAATQAVSSTFRLLHNFTTDFLYERALEYMAESVQKMRQLKQLFRELLTTNEDGTARLFNNQEYRQFRDDFPFILQLIQSYPTQEQASLLIRLFQEKILTAVTMQSLISHLSAVDPALKKTMANALSDTFPYPESDHYKQIYAVLTGEMSLNLTTPDTIVQDLSQIVNLVGPRTAASTHFLEFIQMLGNPGLSGVQTKIEGYYLSKNLHDFFMTSYSADKDPELAALFPSIHYGNQEMLAQVIKNLEHKQQIAVLASLLHRSTVEGYSTIETTLFINTHFDRTVIQALLTKERLGLSATEQGYFTALETALGIDESGMTLPPESLLTMQAILDATFPPDGGEPSKLVPLLKLTAADGNIKKLTQLQANITGHLFAKKITAYFEEPESTRNHAQLSTLLPNLSTVDHWSTQPKAAKVLAATLKALPPEQQTQVLIALFTQQQITSSVAKYLFGDSSPLEFKVIFNVMTALSTEQMTVLVNPYNALHVLRTLFYKYKQSSSREPKEFLRELPEEMLDKLMPQISDTELQNYLDNYQVKLEELPQANTPDWGQTVEIIDKLFENTKANRTFFTQLRSASSPKALKELLLLEIAKGFYYQAENMVGIALKRLAEHEAAIVQSLAPEDGRRHVQLKSGGELGKSLALELECLQGDRRGTGKLNQLKDALSQLPEKISEAELHAQLRDTNSPLSTALFKPVAPTARGFTLFAQKKPPEPDMAFLKEINERLERLDQSLEAGGSAPSLTNRGT